MRIGVTAVAKCCDTRRFARAVSASLITIATRRASVTAVDSSSISPWGDSSKGALFE